jgi:tetratricopeptide (TPR) repeat protein
LISFALLALQKRSSTITDPVKQQKYKKKLLEYLNRGDEFVRTEPEFHPGIQNQVIEVWRSAGYNDKARALCLYLYPDYVKFGAPTGFTRNGQLWFVANLSACGLYDQAIFLGERLGKTAVEDPTRWQFAMYMGHAHLRTGNAIRAQSYYKDSLESLPIPGQTARGSDIQMADAYQGLGEATFMVGDYQNALKYLQKALALQQIALNGEVPEAVALRAASLACLGKDDEAIHVLEALVKYRHRTQNPAKIKSLVLEGIIEKLKQEKRTKLLSQFELFLPEKAAQSQI